nr:hypothetical protein [Tanacetum cinerariifolium]
MTRANLSIIRKEVQSILDMIMLQLHNTGHVSHVDLHLGFCIELRATCLSIVWIGYLGEAYGRKVAEIIFGDENPGSYDPDSILRS